MKNVLTGRMRGKYLSGCPPKLLASQGFHVRLGNQGSETLFCAR